MEKNLMEMNGIEAMEAMVNAQRERAKANGRSNLLKKKIARPQLGCYEALLNNYKPWDDGKGEERLVLQLELLDKSTGEIFRHSDFKNEQGLEYLANSMERWYQRTFEDYEEMLEYMTKTRFYIELVENEVDGVMYTNVKYLTKIA